MRHYERLVEELQNLLTADTDPAEEVLQDVDARYCRAVREINERLNRCDRLLHQGHRAEAIQECEQEPNLLDALAVLDFPEAPQWTEYVRQFELAGPPALAIEIAVDLNDAYTTDAQLGGSLRRHRLLALARAPLDSRLTVLRQIARRDANNPIWQEDLRSWEQVRHQQLAGEIERAATREDGGAIARLEREMTVATWLSPPPESLVQRVRRAHEQVQVRLAQRALEALEPELTAAYADFDVPQAREIRQQWETQAALGITRADDPLLERVEPALRWLEDLDRQEREAKEYEDAVNRLVTALNQGRPGGELERLAAAVQQFEQGLPEPLEQRLASHFQQLERAARRKQQLLLAALAMTMLLIAAAATWAVGSYQRGQRVTAHEENLAQLIRARRFEEGQDYVRNLQQEEPSVYSHPQIQARLNELQAAVEAEHNRRQEFTALLARAEEAGQTWQGYQAARSQLTAAQELLQQGPAHTQSAEQQEWDQVQAAVTTRREQLQTELNEAWEHAYEPWQERFAQRSLRDVDELRQLLADAEELEKRADVEARVKSRIRPQAEELREDLEGESQRQVEIELVERITRALGDRSRYTRSLQTFIERFPDSPRAQDFSRVLEEEAELWEAVEAWEPVIARWSELELNRITPAEAAEKISEVETLLEQYAGYPTASQVQRQVEFLRPIQARVQADGRGLEEELLQTLNVPAVRQFGIVWYRPPQEPLQRLYFLDKPPEVTRRTVTFQALQDDLGRRAGTRELPRHHVDNPREGTSFDWTSPQQRFHRYLQQQLPVQSSAGWESTFVNILEQLYVEPQVEADFRMEPLFKVQILEQVLAIACQGSYAIQEGFGPWKGLIQTARDGGLDLGANWIDPDDLAANHARADAQSLLDRMAPFEVAKSRTVAIWKEMLARPPWHRHYWVGCLLRDEQGNWSCELGPASVRFSGDLVVLRTDTGSRLAWTRIGHLEDGRANLTLSRSAGQREGRPVFVAFSP